MPQPSASSNAAAIPTPSTKQPPLTPYLANTKTKWTSHNEEPPIIAALTKDDDLTRLFDQPLNTCEEYKQYQHAHSDHYDYNHRPLTRYY
jgi:hypothetical protein